MIVVDSSALCAIAFGEPAAARVAERLSIESEIQVSASTYVELVTVVASRDPLGRKEGRLYLDGLLHDLRVTLVDFDVAQSDIAADGWLAYGRGSRQPSKLNLGDTFAYALAKSRRAPLLYVGADFAHTDIEPALP